jgi:hypothetical protein
VDNLGLYVSVHLRADTPIRAANAGSAAASLIIEADPTTDVRVYFPAAPDDLAVLGRLAAAVAELRAAIVPAVKPDPLPIYTLEHGQIRRNGEPIVTLVRAVWGDGAPSWAEINAFEAQVVDALNAQAAR